MEHHDTEHHSVGYGPYVIVWVALIGLTGLTVAVAGIDIGMWTVPLALAIATVKTVLVLMYFMHLKYEPFIFTAMIVMCIITFAIFLGLTFFDTLPRYNP